MWSGAKQNPIHIYVSSPFQNSTDALLSLLTLKQWAIPKSVYNKFFFFSPAYVS